MHNKRFYAKKVTEKDLESIYAQTFLVIIVDDLHEIKLNVQDTNDLIDLIRQGRDDLGWKPRDVVDVTTDFDLIIKGLEPDRLTRLSEYIQSKIDQIYSTKTSFSSRDHMIRSDNKIEAYQDVLGMIKDYQEADNAQD